MVKRFSDLATEFLEWANKALKPSTVKVYAHYFRRWVSDNGDHPIDEIHQAHLTAWAKTWHECQAVKRLFGWAVNEAGLLASHPVLKVRPPRKGCRRRIMAPREAARILRAASRDLRSLLIAYRETYARPQELRLATWDDVQAENPKLTTREALEMGEASIVLYDFKDAARRDDSERPRVILLSPRACRLILRLWHRSRHRRGRVFVTGRGMPWTGNALRCRFRRLRKRLGIEKDKRGETIVPYTFRHTGATVAAAAGVRDRLLADVLGHIETKTTARYCHLQQRHLREAMGKVWKAS